MKRLVLNLNCCYGCPHLNQMHNGKQLWCTNPDLEVYYGIANPDVIPEFCPLEDKKED